MARNPQNPGVPKTGSPKRSVYSEIDNFGAFVWFLHMMARNPQNPGVPKTGSPKRTVYSEIDDFDAFVWFPPFDGQKSSKSWSCKDVDDIHLPGPQFLSNT